MDFKIFLQLEIQSGRRDSCFHKKKYTDNASNHLTYVKNVSCVLVSWSSFLSLFGFYCPIAFINVWRFELVLPQFLCYSSSAILSNSVSIPVIISSFGICLRDCIIDTFAECSFLIFSHFLVRYVVLIVQFRSGLFGLLNFTTSFYILSSLSVSAFHWIRSRFCSK